MNIFKKTEKKVGVQKSSKKLKKIRGKKKCGKKKVGVKKHTKD